MVEATVDPVTTPVIVGSAIARLVIPAALFLGGLGLAAFLWALKSGQFEDLDGAANRILFDDDNDTPGSSR